MTTESAGIVPQTYELVDALTLNLWPGAENPKLHDLDAIGASMEANGVFGALLVQKSTRRVIAGNGSLTAAVSRGVGTVPVLWLDVDDDRARRIMLADNRLSEIGGIDEEKLAALLGSMPDLAGTGYDIGDLDVLELELQQVGLLLGNGAGRTEGGDRSATQRVPNVAVLIAVSEVGVIEDAFAATGEESRGAALVKLARSFLAANAG